MPSTTNAFASLMAAQMFTDLPGDDDELDRYLADSCVQTNDVLAWWFLNRKVYPNLARLAISIHCCMGEYLIHYFYLHLSSFLYSYVCLG